MQENKNLIEDEIDLRELFQIIWNKRMLIIFFTLFITIISGFYIYSKTPIYEVKSYIEIGFIDKEILEDSNSIEQKLRVIFSMDDFNIELNSLENGIVSSIRQIKNVKNLLEIKTEAYSNEVALTKNKEVLNYLQNLYEPKIEQYKVILNNNILDTKREIDYINDIEIKNILAQINMLKEQEIKNIDRQIVILKNQEINLLKAEIEYLSKEKIKNIQEKIVLNTNSLNNYIKEVDKLNKALKDDNSSSLLVVSIQLLNYQNLIADTQNQIKDSELQIYELLKNDIPKLKYRIENIYNVQIKDLEIQKNNVSNETIRKLQDKIDIELKTKITQLNEKIEILSFKRSEQNLSNMRLIGEYILNNNPIKPKKSLTITVSFISGFIVSIFLVFLLNFINNSRKEF